MRVLAALSLAAAAGPGAARAQAAYEETAELRASQLLPADLLRGPHHEVEEAVESDGLVPVYRVRSEYGIFQARGEARLRERIAEIEAMAALRAARDSDAWSRAAERAGRAPASGGAAVAVPGLPVGVAPAGPPAAEAGAGRALDLEAARRRIAADLGVDPYTTNPALRRELESHAWVAVAGGLSSGLIGREAEPPAEAREELPRVARLLRDWSTDDLVRLNRLELVAMGVDEPLREEFLTHPSYSPQTGTVLVDALSGLEGTGDRATFIEAAVAAASEDEAHEFRRMAELIRGYDERSGRIERITTVDGRVAAFAADGTLVVPVLADHALWTRRVADFAESMARASGRDPALARTRFLVSGRVSPRARSEIQGRGIEVTDGLAGGDAEGAPDP